MRSRTIIVVAVAAVIFGGLAVTALALAGPSAAARRALVFVGRQQPGNLIVEQVDKTGPQDLGDIVAFTSDLLVNGKPAGEVHVASVGVDRYKHLSQATGTVTLRNATIAFAGLVSQRRNSTLTVLGGTGAYIARRGTLTVATNGGANTITIKLS